MASLRLRLGWPGFAGHHLKWTRRALLAIGLTGAGAALWSGGYDEVVVARICWRPEPIDLGIHDGCVECDIWRQSLPPGAPLIALGPPRGWNASRYTLGFAKPPHLVREVYFDWTRYFLPLWWFVAASLGLIMLTGVHQRRPPGFCQRCAYNLTGNVSRRCPECGQPVPVAQDVGHVRADRASLCV